MPIPILDLLLVLLLVAAVPWLARWDHGRLVEAVGRGVAEARVRAYRKTLIWQWGVAAAAVLLWWLGDRTLFELGLRRGEGVRAWVGAGAALVAMVLLVVQAVSVLRSREKLEELRPQFEELRELLPHDARESRWFTALSITAGICEELVYRGFLMRYLAVQLGLPIAVVLSSAIFGLGHLYQGRMGVFKTAGVGLVMAGVTVLSQSLWPAMLLHATIDVTSGLMGRRVATLPPPRPETDGAEPEPA